jgi:alpha-D-ribose 1-methylphosphonate 5-triphosphate synthase subunit PhnG
MLNSNREKEHAELSAALDKELASMQAMNRVEFAQNNLLRNLKNVSAVERIQLAKSLIAALENWIEIHE